MVTRIENQRPMTLHYRECGDRVPNAPCVCALIAARRVDREIADLRARGYRVEAPRGT